MINISQKNSLPPGNLLKLAGSFIITTFFISCGENAETIYPEKENITESVYASGVIKTNDQYQVFSPVPGIIQKIYVAEGDTVQKGDPILHITSEAARLNIQGAQLGVESASINANRDKLNEVQANINFLKAKLQNDSLLLERQRRLWEQQIGSRVELE